MIKKTCERCKKEFVATNPEHKLCRSCWDSGNRRCECCNRIINDLPEHFRFCRDCYSTIFHHK